MKIQNLYLKLRGLRYTLPLIIVPLIYLTLTHEGTMSWLIVIFAFVLAPLLGILLPAPEYNLTDDEKEVTESFFLYNLIIYSIPFVQVWVVLFYTYQVTQNFGQVSLFTLAGWTLSTGLITTTYAANAGHELGHRDSAIERFLGSIADMTMLSPFRPIAHNSGHHKNVATPEDSVSAKYNEWVYLFWFRAMTGAYFEAWKIENERLRKEGKKVISFHNHMIVFQLLKIVIFIAITWAFGYVGLIAFLVNALVANIFHETVCYIEHYGLQRNKLPNGSYERVQPHHSWNSEKIIGRMLFFELPRHSHHHFKADVKYQSLNHYDKVPDMPLGYPAMIALSTFPPLWFAYMNPKVKEIRKEFGPSLT